MRGLHQRLSATRPEPGLEDHSDLVRRGASIGANATLVCGIEVGEYAMIAAGSVVTRDVAPYQLVAGNPARPKGWVDEQGEVVSRDVDNPPRRG